MPRRKTRKQVLSECETSLKNGGLSCFYRSKCVNNYGNTVDNSIPYTEVIAEWLLENGIIDQYSDIQSPRNNSYNLYHLQNGISFSNKEGAHNSEKTIAKRLYLVDKTINVKETLSDGTLVIKGIDSSNVKEYEFGRILDFEVPLNAYQDSNHGDIDLLSIDTEKKTAYILELKKPSSKETLLRCVLEGYTYLNTVAKEQLFKDFAIPSDYILKTAPPLFLPIVKHIRSTVISATDPTLSN